MTIKLIAVLCFLVFLGVIDVQPGHPVDPGLGNFLKEEEQLLGYGQPALTAYAGKLLHLTSTGEIVGRYHIWFHRLDGNSFRTTIEVHNDSPCNMHFGGYFLSNGKPMKVIEWGAGFPIGPGEHWEGEGQIYFRGDSSQRLTFEPQGDLYDCKPKKQSNVTKNKDAANKVKEEARKEERAEAEAARSREQRQSAQQPARQPVQGQLSCQQCGQIAWYLCSRTDPCLSRQEANTWAAQCSSRSDCSGEGFFSQWKFYADETVRQMRTWCR